jgi:hypothetical protein
MRRRHGREAVAGSVVVAMGFAAGDDSQRDDHGGQDKTHWNPR